jgi:large subunit ribosomal protein L24
MKCFHVKRGDEVVVLTGTEKGKRGKIIRVLTKKDRVVIEGVKMMKKHVRKSQEHPQGAILDIEGSIHVSNVMRADRYDASAARPSSSSAETA